MVLPKIEAENLAQNYGRFIISPLERGFGITVGNALRRVLLAALPGAAVTSIKIDGVHHEFSTMEGVKEDTIELLLNVKQLRMILHTDEPVKLRLQKNKEGPVMAGDIECPSSVEIVNPDLRLATLDSDKARLEMELTAQKGRGYSPAEERGKLAIGEIPVDAIFSPIRQVSFLVEKERVGQAANFDKLIFEIWTDGTIRPQDALSTSAQILMDYFDPISAFGQEAAPEVEVVEAEGAISSAVYEIPIEELGLSVRAYNCLKRAGITKVGEILERLAKGDEEILAIRNFGRKSLDELKERLLERGYIAIETEEVGAEVPEA